MAVRMELSRILIRELNDLQLIELREVTGDAAPSPFPEENSNGSSTRAFPIVIGRAEAEAIERRLKGITVKRPQTHDLMANIITALGGELQSITINDLSEHTFFATLDVKCKDGTLLHIDSRPSDAIALGIAGSVPIFVAEHVLESAMTDEV